MGFLGQPAIELELVSRCEGKAGGVQVAVHVVRVYTVKSLLHRQIKPRAQDWCQDVKGANVHPAFSVPAFVGCAQYAFRVQRSVWSPIFPTPG